ncbi:MAG: tRNA-dihydrouridine synthase family protein [Lachnospiraceae bacterium]|nr:tRNA-dihydrouridine synthase family protein [Lachnospiraceae bacterium]
MQFYLAPMEGVTGCIVRNAFKHHFVGIDRYFTPFIPMNCKLDKRTYRELSPENNQDIMLIPQLLSNDAAAVVEICAVLQGLGYDIVNINLGCPSGTVCSKERGSGFLKNPEKLDRFFDEIFTNVGCKISVKTRIGFHSLDEWENILEVYAKYPFEELIIHPRLRNEFYNGEPHPDAFNKAVSVLKVPLCYNGDIVDEVSYKNICCRFPSVERIMIGRGAIANPGLIQELSGGEAVSDEQIWEWHNEILEGYIEIFSNERDVLFHLKEIWTYLGQTFSDKEKQLKIIKKAQNLVDYKIAVKEILR